MCHTGLNISEGSVEMHHTQRFIYMYIIYPHIYLYITYLFVIIMLPGLIRNCHGDAEKKIRHWFRVNHFPTHQHAFIPSSDVHRIPGSPANFVRCGYPNQRGSDILLTNPEPSIKTHSRQPSVAGGQ